MGRAPFLCVLLLWASPALAQSGSARIPPPDPDDLQIELLLNQVETAVSRADRTAWLALLSDNADRDAADDFFNEIVPQGITRVVVRERDRQRLPGALPGNGYSLIVEVFIETGSRGRISTWQLDIRRPEGDLALAPGETAWRVVGQDRLSQVDALYRLALSPDKRFAAKNLVISSVDFELRLPAGDVFVAETPEGITAMVLIGDGTMVFSPTPKTEQGQVRLFAGAEVIETKFESAFVRFNPFDVQGHVSTGGLVPAAAEPRLLARARTIFDDEVSRSFSLDLSDLSRDTWSIMPQAGDFVAEVRTKRFRTLTYARSTGEAEDVSVFSRERKKNISIYASEQKLASRGVFYDEDDLAEIDVLDYDVDVQFAPEREWLDGRTRLKLRVKAYALGVITLRLGEPFTVSSVTSDKLGRLLFLRVRNQNGLVINLPSPVARDFELTLTIHYQGRVARQAIAEESVVVQGGPPRAGVPVQRPEDAPIVPAEPNWLLSNRTFWYPQAPVSDYATATLRVTVPAEYGVVGSGQAVPNSPVLMGPAAGAVGNRGLWVFSATQPVRYLGLVVSRMTRVDWATVALDIVPPGKGAGAPTLMLDAATGRLGVRAVTVPPIGTRNTVTLAVDANKRQESRGRDALLTGADILRFYAAMIGDVPYDTFTVAMVEHDVPGGHSPGYFAVLNNPLPTTPFVYRSDPASFSDFPEFFLAHEIAHQWWGQAVGWKNYHEQWLSEGLAQYFAALYAKEKRGDQGYRNVLRTLRRWAQDQSDQGPVSLGYRLGHVRGDQRVFRALVYNKGAMVLHMLRRLVGEEAFLRGLRRFYAENRFKKAGTDDLRRAMAEESGRDLDRFFSRWIYDTALPRVRMTTAVESDTLRIRYEQAGDPFDVPVTVTLQYADGRSEDVVVPVTDVAGEHVVPLAGTLRGVDVNEDGGALGSFEKR
jgi:hypothetical protein